MGLSMSFFIFMYLSFVLSFFQFTSSRQLLCHDNERIALLRFKESFVIRKLASSDPSAHPKAASWKLEENSDCCSWEGIKCNEDTGYVIKLDLTSSYLYGSLNSASNALFNLVHLQWLSLADNHFNDSKIPYGIKNLSNLSHLNLSYSVFSGQIPLEMLELSNLESLDLSYNSVLLHLQHPGLKSLSEKLTNLKVLGLGGVNISSSLPQVLTNLSSLKYLSLRDCNLLGTIPSVSNLNSLTYFDLSNNHLQGTIPSISNLNSLTHLDLSNNYLQGTIPSINNFNSLTHLDLSNNYLQGKISYSLGDITNLKHLDLSSNNFGGKISSSLGNLTSVSYLDLSHNNFEGMLLSSLGYLNNLIHLDLSWNDFWGKIPSSLGNLTNLAHLDMSCNSFSNPDPFSLTKLTHLNHLDLSFNNFSSPSSSLSWISKNTELTFLGLSNINIDEIPFWLLKMNQLSTLYLSSNQISGPIPPEIGNLTKLKNLYLSSNQLQGSIPSSLFELNNLEELYLSSNNLSGTIEFKMFLRLKSLSRLDLSSNHLSLLTNSTVNASSHKFHVLTLGSCNLKGFPDFLRDQDQLEWLDLSSNNITGQIPGWLLNISQYSLERLNLSHNLLIGFDHQPVVLLWAHLYSLDLSFNNLQSPLPIPPTSTLQVYLVSHNKMSGQLQPWICKLNSLLALDLSNNSLSGKLPRCLGNFSKSMLVLNLQNNKFRGSIPQTFMNGTKLQMIDLSNNMLHGKIPRSVANCTMLEVLDLGNNKISDTFPFWIGTLPNLKVLNLQLNMKLYNPCKPNRSLVYSSAISIMSTKAAVSPVVSSPNDHIKGAKRQTADFPKNIWGDRFFNYNYKEEEINRANQLQQIQQLKEEVRRELSALADQSLSQQLNLIDVIRRLGVGYHFQREIQQVLQQIYDTYCHNDEDVDQYDLHTVALFFRLLREHGHYVSCDIFNKFKDNKGNFKEALTSDVSGMLSLYEAAQLGVHGEDILDEAITFTTTHLQSIVTHLSNPLASQTIHALRYSQRQRVRRIESRRDISLYQDDASHNQTLLKLAKLDFNYLQSLHKQELSEICRWWKDLDLATKLPFARERMVECYFWILIVFHEPQHSLARRIMSKGLPLISAIDDIYDTYGSPEQLNLFTEAIDRWDVSSMDQLPDYMQTIYKALWDLFAEVEELVASRGWSYRVHYAKEMMKKLIHAYFDESKRFEDNRIPTMDEYMQVSLVSSGYNTILILSFVGMEDCIVTEETLDWMLNRPTIIRAIELMGRVMNDITSHKFEQKRGHAASSVECYMKEYGVSELEACEQLYKLVRNSWKDVNKEYLQLADHVPAPILKSILNLGKSTYVFYDEDDNYTHVGKQMRAYIESVLIDPIPM